jgi:hypothetical protein
MTVTSVRTRDISAGGATALLAGRALWEFLRNPALVISSFVFPLLLMFLNLAVFNRVVSDATGMPYVARLAPLIVLSTITFSAVVTATGFFDDVRNGLLDRLRTMLRA